MYSAQNIFCTLMKIFQTPSSFCTCLSMSAIQFLRVIPAEFKAAASMEDLFLVESYRQRCVGAFQKEKKVCLLLHGVKLQDNLFIVPQEQIVSHLLSTKQEYDRSHHTFKEAKKK